MGGSQSRIESRDGSGHGRYAHSGSFQQPAAPQYPAYPPYGAPPQQGGYAAPYPAYQLAPVATPQPPARGGGASKPRLDRRYSRIADDFQTVEQVTDALAQTGLESSNLLVGIDFTKSNEWTGKFSYHGRSSVPNPYEQGLSILGQTLSKFDEDNLIPCFGFGDASTHDQDVFCFYPDERPCNGFSEALDRYRELVPHLRLAGPTSFAPIIEMAMTIVEQSGGQYHVPLIIADGQVTRSVDTASGQLSSQEQKTVDAIVRARIYLPSCRSIYEKGSMQDKRWQNSQSTHYNKKMPSPQHLLSKNCDGIFHQALNDDTVVDVHRIQGSIEGEHGGPPADNNTTTTNNNPNDQESLEDEEPTEFVLKDKELFIIVKAVSILVAAVIVFSLAIFGMVHYSMGYPAINKLQKECILAGLVGFVPFSVITVGVVHSVEGRAKAIDLATTMVIAEITYGLFAVCHAAMVIGKPPWFIVVPLFLVAWSVLVGWLVWRYRRPRGMYVMLKKIFKFKMHGQ